MIENENVRCSQCGRYFSDVEVHTRVHQLEQKLAERDAALARCVEAVDSEPELPGRIDDEMWYVLKLMFDANDRDGISEAMRIVVRETKKGIKKRLVSSIPTSAQATAKVLVAARRLGETLDGYTISELEAAETALIDAIREEQSYRSSETS